MPAVVDAPEPSIYQSVALVTETLEGWGTIFCLTSLSLWLLLADAYAKC